MNSSQPHTPGRSETPAGTRAFNLGETVDRSWETWPMDGDSGEVRLTMDEAFRAAYYLIDDYVKIEGDDPQAALVLYRQYMWSDPGREEDWRVAVDRARSDEIDSPELPDWKN